MKKTMAIMILAVMFIVAGCISGCSVLRTHDSLNGETETGTIYEPDADTETSSGGVSGDNTGDEEDTGATDDSADVPEPDNGKTGDGASDDSESEPIDEALVNIKDYIPQAYVELKYAGDDNFTGKAIYDFTEAYLRYGTVKKLIKVQEELEKYGYVLKIWDACRPVSAQYDLWEACPDASYVADPRKKYSSHSTGNTVDLTLVTRDGEEIEMPSGFDEFSALGDRDYGDVSSAAARNAELLQSIMYENGFDGYYKEWWHYSDEDKYAVAGSFSNEDATMWRAECDEWISLRKTASVSADRLCTVPKDDSLELLGFNGKFARVKYHGQEGYVLSNYIVPGNGGYRGELEIVMPDGDYTYEQMIVDIEKLEAAYPDKITVGSIGQSEEGRDIPVVVIGDVNAGKHVLIQGAIHAREHMTACVMMCQTEYVLAYADSSFRDHGSIADAMEGVCFHIIPMVNPDGVAISQSDDLSERQLEIYESDTEKRYTNAPVSEYAAAWKANANGVDLNRNFDAGWAELEGRSAPSSERYKGTAPEDQAESIALAEYARSYPFCATVSYHAHGCVIYFDYGGNEDTVKKAYALSKAVESVSGYKTVTDKSLDAGGFKDWAIAELEIPSITVEIGCSTAPLEQKELYSAYERNKTVYPAVAEWVKNGY